MDKVPRLALQNDPYHQYSNEDHIIITPTLLSEFTETSLIGVKRVNIKFSDRKHKRTGGYLPKIIRKKVYIDELLTDRTMESGSEGLDFPEDAIDKVAKANYVHLESTNILPQVRAAPCTIHAKYSRKNDSLPGYHGGSVVTIPTGRRNKSSLQPTLGKDVLVGRGSTGLGGGAERSLVDETVKTRASLPKTIPSKEFVLTWLMYGSDPCEKNHFPELIKTSTPLKPKQKHRKGQVSGDFNLDE